MHLGVFFGQKMFVFFQILTRVDQAWKGKYFPWVPEGGGVDSMKLLMFKFNVEKCKRQKWQEETLCAVTSVGISRPHRSKTAWCEQKNRKSAQLDKQLGYIQEKPDRVSTQSAQTVPEKTTRGYLCESGQTIEWVVFFRLFQEVALTRNLRPIEDTTESLEGVTKEKEECCQRT